MPPSQNLETLLTNLLPAFGRDAGWIVAKSNYELDTEDLIQEGCLAVLREAPKYPDLKTPLARTIARHAMINAARKPRRGGQHPKEGYEGLVADQCLVDLDVVSDVREALSELSPQHLQAILSTLDGPPYLVCGDLGLPLSVLRSRIRVARDILRERLGDGYDYMSKRFNQRYGPAGRSNEKQRRKAKAAKATAGDDTSQAA